MEEQLPRMRSLTLQILPWPEQHYVSEFTMVLSLTDMNAGFYK